MLIKQIKMWGRVEVIDYLDFEEIAPRLTNIFEGPREEIKCMHHAAGKRCTRNIHEAKEKHRSATCTHLSK